MSNVSSVILLFDSSRCLNTGSWSRTLLSSEVIWLLASNKDSNRCKPEENMYMNISNYYIYVIIYVLIEFAIIHTKYLYYKEYYIMLSFIINTQATLHRNI